MVRMFFLLSGLAVLASGPLSYKPTPILASHVKQVRVIPVNADPPADARGPLLQQ